MYKAKHVMTPEGLEDYKAEIRNLGRSLFYFTNNADDMHMGSDDRSERLLQAMYEIQRAIQDGFLLNGDGEENEYFEEKRQALLDGTWKGRPVSPEEAKYWTEDPR